MEEFVGDATPLEVQSLLNAALRANLHELMFYFRQIMVHKELCGTGKATFNQLIGWRGASSSSSDSALSSGSTVNAHEDYASELVEESKEVNEPVVPKASLQAPSCGISFVESKSLDNRQAKMIPFSLKELEHFVFMMHLEGTDSIEEYIRVSPVFKGLQPG